MTYINLLPWRQQLREQQQRDFKQKLSLAVLFAILLLLLSHVYMASKISSQIGRNDLLRHYIEEYNQKIVEIEKLQKLRSSLIARINIIQTLEQNRPLVVHFFDELVNVLPDGVYLTKAVRQGSKVTIEGYAESNTNISQLMRNIEKSRWLSAPELREIKQDELDSKKEANKFILELLLQPKDIQGPPSQMIENKEKDNKKAS